MISKENKMKVVRVGKLVTKKLGDCLWMVMDRMKFYVDGVRFTVPIGFTTDGASCPKILWSLCAPMSGPQVEAAILHDFMYSKDSGWKISRKFADDVFYNAMRADGTSLWRAKAIYYGVRAGGAGSYKKCYSVEKLKG
jgi:hypothetical protein